MTNLLRSFDTRVRNILPFGRRLFAETLLATGNLDSPFVMAACFVLSTVRKALDDARKTPISKELSHEDFR
jgi:hypothetical protein